MGEPASLEPEVAFLRSQVVTLQARLCETLAQQVAQQQTVLIAAMQTNLALTQTADRMNRIADVITDIANREEARESNREGAARGTGPDFSSIFATLAPYLIGAATNHKADPSHKADSSQTPATKDQSPKDPPPLFTLPKEVTDLMRNRQAPQTLPASVTTVLKPRAGGAGYEETTRTEVRKIYPDPTRANPVLGAPAPQVKKSNSSKETRA